MRSAGLRKLVLTDDEGSRSKSLLSLERRRVQTKRKYLNRESAEEKTECKKHYVDATLSRIHIICNYYIIRIIVIRVY